MTNHSSQGVYAPLPQSLSDSDSEKDIPVRTKFADRLNNVSNGVHESTRHNGYITPLQMMKMPDVRKVTPSMSIKRKACFVFSIAICFLTIIVFLWVIPCSESGTCPIRISNWENQHDGIELTGKINVVKSAFKNTANLVLLFKQNLNADSQNGIISVLGNNGAVAWYINQAKSSEELNCYLIDVNGDDINDCLVLGEMGLEAVDPISGSVFWHAHNHSENIVMTDLDFPVILQDLNYDNINEILTTANPITGDSKFLIISGKTGILLGEIGVVRSGRLNIIAIDASHIVYSRIFDNGTIYHEISISELISRIFNRGDSLNLPKIKFMPNVHNGYWVNGRKLLINNIGTCPDSCRVDIALVDVKKDQNTIAWSYQNSYSFIPTSFSFKQTKSNLSSLKGHVNGFILKLWQWSGYNHRDKSKRHPAKRYIPTPGNNSLPQINTIMERVVLITFNNTNFHVINASLTEITQLCFLTDTKPRCQPTMENQNNSLLITDLDMDGSQELVSYSSTYIKRDDQENWQLVSNMKVIRLEAELPKLYEVAK